MSKRKVFSIFGMVLMVVLIVCMFLPFLSDGDTTLSFWKYIDKNVESIEVNIVLLIELVVGCLIFLLQLCGALKDAKFVYFPLGYYITYNILVAISLIRIENFKYLSFGYYIGFFTALITLILVIAGSCSSNESKKNKVKASFEKEPIGFDPKTGKPIYEEEKSKEPVGYDPKTGEPIYEEEKPNKPIRYDTKTGEPIYEEEKPKKPLRYDPKTGEPIYK